MLLAQLQVRGRFRRFLVIKSVEALSRLVPEETSFCARHMKGNLTMESVSTLIGALHVAHGG